MLLQEFRNSYHRAPNWCWLRAAQVDEGGPRPRKAVDGDHGFAWIRRAIRLKRRYAAVANNPDGAFRLMQCDAPLFWAHSIWLNDREPMRWALEARILANEQNDQIANRMGTDPEVVEAYEAVFFNVRDRLEQTDYIATVVMGEAVKRGLSERQYDLLWKLFGYQGGSHVLDAVISKFSPITKPDRAEDVGQFFQDFAVNTVKHKAALATLTVPLNSHTQLALIENFVKYVEIEKNSDSPAKAHSNIIENIGAMLGALPFRIGTKLDAEPEKMLPYDNNAAELRSDEMLIVASGGKLDDQQTLQNLRFPGE